MKKHVRKARCCVLFRKKFGGMLGEKKRRRGKTCGGKWKMCETMKHDFVLEKMSGTGGKMLFSR